MAQRATTGHYLGSQEFQSGQQGITLLLAPAGAVEGKAMVQETGPPLANVEVWLLPCTGGRNARSGQERRGRRVSESPTFSRPVTTFGRLYPAGCRLAVMPDYGLATVTAGQTTRDVRIRATAGVLVEVSVVSTNDLKPLANVAVSSGRLTAFTAKRQSSVAHDAR